MVSSNLEDAVFIQSYFSAHPLGEQPAVVSSEAVCFCLGLKHGPRRGSLTGKEPGELGIHWDEGRDYFLSISETNKSSVVTSRSLSHGGIWSM